LDRLTLPDLSATSAARFLAAFSGARVAERSADSALLCPALVIFCSPIFNRQTHEGGGRAGRHDYRIN